MPAQVGTLVDAPLAEAVVELVVATLLGLFLGLEREWAGQQAGIRTFSLTSLVGAIFTLVAESTGFDGLLVVGGVLVLLQAALLAVEGYAVEGPHSMNFTTSVSLMAAYGVGILVVLDAVLPAVAVAVVSSLLLVLKQELHGFAGGLSREELRSITEFGILAFVVLPLLPPGDVVVAGVTVEPFVAWLMVVTVAGIGIVNYAVVRTYGGRGVAVTGFFGGLASSTAAVGAMLDHVRRSPNSQAYALAGVLLADAAMAVRNLGIALAFSYPAVLVGAVVPLGTVLVVAVAVAARLAGAERGRVDIDLSSPFSLRNVLLFGVVFLFILALGAVAQSRFGTAGFLVSAAVSGLVSSGGATTAAVLLYRGGSVGADAAIVAILLATAASIVVKAGLAFTAPRGFAVRVARWSLLLLVAAGLSTAIVTLL